MGRPGKPVSSFIFASAEPFTIWRGCEGGGLQKTGFPLKIIYFGGASRVIYATFTSYRSGVLLSKQSCIPRQCLSGARWVIRRSCVISPSHLLNLSGTLSDGALRWWNKSGQSRRVKTFFAVCLPNRCLRVNEWKHKRLTFNCDLMFWVVA